MANIKIVQPTHLIDEGRQIFNYNDSLLNSEITNLNNQITNHNHNSLYYTKAEVDQIVRQSIATISLTIPEGGSGTYARIGGLTIGGGFVIPIVVDMNLIEVQMATINGEKVIWDTFTSISFTRGVDTINLYYSETIPGDSLQQYYAGLVILKNGQTALNLKWRAPDTLTRAIKIVNLIFKVRVGMQ